jgi:hypothetical protein
MVRPPESVPPHSSSIDVIPNRIGDEGMRKAGWLVVLGLLLLVVFPGCSARTRPRGTLAPGPATSSNTPGLSEEKEMDSVCTPTPPPGYAGTPSLYGHEIRTNEVVVMEDTVSATTSGSWQAWGLIRNETHNSANLTIVTATLFGEKDLPLGQVSSSALALPLCPGEPGPFHIKSDIPSDQVTRVDWTVSHSSQLSRVSRAVTPMIDWQVPYGVSAWKGTTRSGPTYPYLLMTSYINNGPPVQDARLIAAWLTPEGKVVWIEESGLHPNSTRPVAKGSSGAFGLIQVGDAFQPSVLKPEPREPHLTGLGIMLWTVGTLDELRH